MRALRDVLTATGAGIYLSTHIAGPIPNEVMIAVHESDDLELRIGRVGPDRADDLEQRHKEASRGRRSRRQGLARAHRADAWCPEAVSAVALSILARGPSGRGRPPLSDRSSAVWSRPSWLPSRPWWPRAEPCLEQLDTLPRIVASDVAVLLMAHVDGDGNVADIAGDACGPQGRSAADRGRQPERRSHSARGRHERCRCAHRGRRPTGSWGRTR